MTSVKELETMLWVAVDILHSSRDSSDYLACLSRLLLLKRLSDVFEEEAEAIERETGDRNLAWNHPDQHRFFIPEGARWDSLRRLNQQVAVGLNQAVSAVESANPSLKGVFSSFDFCRDTRLGTPQNRDNLLLQLILKFSNCRLRNQDLENPSLIGQVYETLIEKAAIRSREMGSQFYTPNSVANLLVRLLKPQPGISICDPTCGTGGFLIECARRIQQQGGNLHKVWFYGQEVNSNIWALAQINMLLHDIPNFDIRQGDIILNPQLVTDNELMRFDLVLSDPPFGMRNWGHEISEIDSYHRFRYGIPPRSTGELAFIQHILATLKSTGRATVVVPNGVLFRGASEGSIREGIIKADLIEAVIGLPSNMLFSTGIPIAILIFNQDKPKERRDRVLIVDANSDRQARGRRNPLSVEDIDRIVSTYTNFSQEEGYSKVVTLEELAGNGYALNINRYVLPPKVTIDVKAEIAKLQELETQRTESENKVKQYLQELGIKM